MTRPKQAEGQGTEPESTIYRRAGVKDLVTVTLLKLPPRGSSADQTAAAVLTGIEAEINCWDTAKPILAARRIRKDGTRGVRLVDIAEVHDHLIDGAHNSVDLDPSRYGWIATRATHTFDADHAAWGRVLSTEN